MFRKFLAQLKDELQIRHVIFQIEVIEILEEVHSQ